ncbi:MAG: hypothetical protein HY683_03685 [Chloroflexi bacterium]|nr:hypothetical protein [Chloroflexota bacterium]
MEGIRVLVAGFFLAAYVAVTVGVAVRAWGRRGSPLWMKVLAGTMVAIGVLFFIALGMGLYAVSHMQIRIGPF